MEPGGSSPETGPKLPAMPANSSGTRIGSDDAADWLDVVIGWHAGGPILAHKSISSCLWLVPPSNLNVLGCLSDVNDQEVGTQTSVPQSHFELRFITPDRVHSLIG